MNVTGSTMPKSLSAAKPSGATPKERALCAWDNASQPPLRSRFSPARQRQNAATGRSLLLMALGCLMAVAMVGCSKDNAPPARGWGGGSERSVPVVAVPATFENLKENIVAVGTAEALSSVTLFPESAGVVTEIHFNPDDQVKQGDLLLSLDDRDQSLALELARVELEEAERVVRRFTTVNARNANIAESQLDEARAAVDRARIALRQAEVALDRRHIKAPFDGWVGLTEIERGDRIDTNTVVTSIDDRSQLLVNFSTPEAYVGQVQLGTQVTVKLWNDQSGGVSGRVIAVDSRVDPMSRAFAARAAVDNVDDRFRPGMAFEIGIDVDRGRFLSVPDVSVQWGADGAYIWVVKNNRASRRAINLVKRLPNRLLIEADLSAGTQIISEGVQAMREGVALRLFDSDELDQGARQQLAQPSASEKAESGKDNQVHPS